jgi:hypothetical protein
MSEMPDVLNPEVLAELSDRGMAIYNERLKAKLEPEFNGKVVAVHLDTGAYTVARNSSFARRALREKYPDGVIMTLDIGPVPMDDPLSVRMRQGMVVAGKRE